MMRFEWIPLAGLLLIGLALGAFLWPGLSLAGINNRSDQHKGLSPMPSRAKIPPVDAAVPVKIETATFALG
jgi:hypothetical protein